MHLSVNLSANSLAPFLISIHALCSASLVLITEPRSTKSIASHTVRLFSVSASDKVICAVAAAAPIANPAKANDAMPPVAIERPINATVIAAPITKFNNNFPQFRWDSGSSLKRSCVCGFNPRRIPCSPNASNWNCIMRNVSPPPVGGLPPPVPFGIIKPTFACACTEDRPVCTSCGVLNVTIGASMPIFKRATI